MSGKAKTAQKGPKVPKVAPTHERVMQVDAARGGRRRFIWRPKVAN